MVGGRDHSSQQPNSVIFPCAEDEQEPLPTAKSLIAFFLEKTLFFCDDSADNTSPRHSSNGGDIASRTLEGENDEWQQELPFYVGHSRSAIRRRSATTGATGAVSPSMEEIATRLSASQEYEQFNSYPSNDAATNTSVYDGFLFNLPKSNLSSARTCFVPNNSASLSVIPCGDTILGKQEPPQQQNRHQYQQTVLATTRLSSASQEYEQFNSYPSNDAATNTSVYDGFLFNLPKSNLSPAQTCFFPNNSASLSVIPCGDTILGKQEPPQQQNRHQYQQTVLSRKGAETSSTYHDDNALVVDIASVITPNLRRERVTSFTYVVMCQFEKAAFVQTDRKGNRAKTPLGYVGLKCKYCGGGEGARTGRYFPSSLKTFTDTTKTLLPMYCHLILCHKCPGDMKSLISRLHDRHEVELKVLKGKKLHRHGGGTMPFYRQIWTSLHADASSSRTKDRRAWS